MNRRDLVLSLTLAVAVGAAWIAFSRTAAEPLARDGVAAIEPTTSRALAPRKAQQQDLRSRPEPSPLVAPASTLPATLDSPTLPQQGPTLPQQGTGPRTLDGRVTDRFGWPQSGERVWLVPGAEGHPQSGDDLERLVTATTNSKGNFSLTLPDEGPWRLAVGPPGGARTTPTDPRTLDVSQRVEVMLSGGAELQVSFNGLPPGDEVLTLELVALAEGGERGRGGGGRGGNTRGAGATGEQEGQGRGGRGQRDGDRTRDSEEEPNDPPEPPPEVWRSAHEHEFSAEERAAGEVRIGGLRVGRVSRLALRIGDERLEGFPRFTLTADTVTKLRVFTITTDSNTALNYAVSIRTLARDESPAGARWVE